MKEFKMFGIFDKYGCLIAVAKDNNQAKRESMRFLEIGVETKIKKITVKEGWE
jgi:hypothetical protein